MPPAKDALKLQMPLPEGASKVVTRGEKRGGAIEAISQSSARPRF